MIAKGWCNTGFVLHPRPVYFYPLRQTFFLQFSSRTPAGKRRIGLFIYNALRGRNKFAATRHENKDTPSFVQRFKSLQLFLCIESADTKSQISVLVLKVKQVDKCDPSREQLAVHCEESLSSSMWRLRFTRAGSETCFFPLTGLHRTPVFAKVAFQSVFTGLHDLLCSPSCCTGDRCIPLTVKSLPDPLSRVLFPSRWSPVTTPALTFCDNFHEASATSCSCCEISTPGQRIPPIWVSHVLVQSLILGEWLRTLWESELSGSWSFSCGP